VQHAAGAISSSCSIARCPTAASAAADQSAAATNENLPLSLTQSCGPVRPRAQRDRHVVAAVNHYLFRNQETSLQYAITSYRAVI